MDMWTEKICEHCIYSEKSEGFFGDKYFCRRMINDIGEYVRVSSTGTCDYFLEKSTKSNSGYRGGSCFLTSACVEYMNKPDNCDELTKLRAFRDEVLNLTEQGRFLVNRYYDIAPKIVKEINNSLEKEKVYAEIYAIIIKCVDLIEQKKFDDVIECYKNMVIMLQNRYEVKE